MPSENIAEKLAFPKWPGAKWENVTAARPPLGKGYPVRIFKIEKRQ
jgi:hypothetical protein